MIIDKESFSCQTFILRAGVMDKKGLALGGGASLLIFLD